MRPAGEGPQHHGSGADVGRRGGRGAPPRTRGPGVPRVLVPLAAAGAVFVVAPVVALLAAAPWSRLPSVLAGPDVWPALRLSLLTASAATVVCVALGVPLAWVLARAALRGRRVLRALVTVPLVLPPVVGGVALLLLLGRRGLLGASLDAVGITIPFTAAAVVIAEAFVALPFLVITVEGALRAVDVRYEEAGGHPGRPAGHGAGPGHPADGGPGDRRRGGAVLRSRPGRVRRHRHLRGHLPGQDHHGARRGLPRPGHRPRRGRRPVGGAAGGLGGRAGLDARAVDRRGVAVSDGRRAAGPGRADDGGLVADVGVELRRDGQGALSLRVPLRVAPGTVTALLGPNGAGKTTVLRALAGLVPLRRGRVVLAGRTLDDPGAGVFVPPHARGARMVFSDHLLLPHLSALDNVAFAPRAAGTPRGAAREAAREVMDALGVGDLAGAAPASLSGGQAQRVALARALVGERTLLLLDEPLAALDAATRALVRTVLRERSGSSPSVLVTHDPLDALVLADDLVVLERGRWCRRARPRRSRGPRAPTTSPRWWG